MESLLFFHANYHISESIRKSAKRGHCMRAEQECLTIEYRSDDVTKMIFLKLWDSLRYSEST